MTLIVKSGDLFSAEADALVNPVNCVGVMGAGVAREFAKRYPEMLLVYKVMCGNKRLRPGMVWAWEASPIILCVATKDHFRNRSRIAWIDEAAQNLIGVAEYLELKSVAMPAIGCGLGGLDWDLVEDVLLDHLEDSPIEFRVLIPESGGSAGSR
jgi:O-acetyl-ADP-ribose deacetylase (regulator of RNase III)